MYCHKVFQSAHAPFDEPYEITNAGLRISLPGINLPEKNRHFGVLNCHQDGKPLALLLVFVSTDSRDRTRNTYGISPTSWDPRATRINVKSAVTTKKSCTMIVRNRPLLSKDRMEPTKLWLRLRNVKFGHRLQVESAYPEDAWNLSGWNVTEEGFWNGSEEDSNERHGDLVAQFTPSMDDGWRCGGIVIRAEKTENRIVICFRWSLTTLHLRPEVRMTLDPEPDLRHICDTLKAEPPVHEVWVKSSSNPRPPLIRTSLNLDMLRRLTAVLRRDEQILDDRSVVLELLPNYTPLGWPAEYASRLLQKLRASRLQQPVSQAIPLFKINT